MTIRPTPSLSLVITLIILLIPPTAWGEIELTAGIEHRQGSYGGERTIRTSTVPFSLAWLGELADFRIEGSFIHQDDPSVTTTLYGESGLPLVQAARFGGPGGWSPTPSSPDTTPPQPSSPSGVSGPGDLILRGGYIFAGTDDLSTHLKGSLFVKLPTAPADKGLGTGKTDLGGALELSAWFSSIHLIAEIGYTIPGKVDGYDLKNSLSLLAGGGIRVTDRIEPMVSIRWESPPSGYSGDLVELREKVTWDWDDASFIDIFLLQGVSRDAPSAAGGVTIGYRFR